MQCHLMVFSAASSRRGILVGCGKDELDEKDAKTLLYHYVVIDKDVSLFWKRINGLVSS